MSWWNPTWNETKDMWAPAFKNVGKTSIGIVASPFKAAYGVGSWAWNKPIQGKKSSYYPTGEASLKELFSTKGYEKGGEWQRSAVTKRIGGWWSGFSGKSQADPDEQGIMDKVKNLLDSGSEFVDAGTKRVEDPFGGWNFQDWLNEQTDKVKMPAMPEGGLVNLAPVKDGMDDFALALAMGLGSLGQGIGGGLPQMPSFGGLMPVNEEGEPNILMIGGLALVAYTVLKGD